MASVMKLDGVQIKKPTEFEIERFNLTKSGRVASGKMKIELIAKKRKFYFSYEVISSTDLIPIINIVDGTKMFFPIEYEENNIIKTATVYAGALKTPKLREGSKWYWRNVTFDLIEQ